MAVRIETLPLLTVRLSIAWLKVKPRRWFSAICVIEQEVLVHPRSHEMTQKLAPLGQRTAEPMPASPVEDEPPEQPARNIADNPLKTRTDRVNKLMGRGEGVWTGVATRRPCELECIGIKTGR